MDLFAHLKELEVQKYWPVFHTGQCVHTLRLFASFIPWKFPLRKTNTQL